MQASLQPRLHLEIGFASFGACRATAADRAGAGESMKAPCSRRPSVAAPPAELAKTADRTVSVCDGFVAEGRRLSAASACRSAEGVTAAPLQPSRAAPASGDLKSALIYSADRLGLQFHGRCGRASEVRKSTASLRLSLRSSSSWRCPKRICGRLPRRRSASLSDQGDGRNCR